MTELTDEQILHSMTKDRSRKHPSFRTICQVHRELYPIVKDNEKALKLLMEAYRMAKKMSSRLIEYKKQFKEANESTDSHGLSNAMGRRV